MSRPTRGRDRTRSAARQRASGVGASTVLPVAAVGLVVVALVVPTVIGHDPAPAAARTTATGEAAPSGDASASSPQTSASSSPSGSPAPSAPASVPQRGAGPTTVLPVPGQDTDRSGRTVTYTVEAEDGVGVDLKEFADIVHQVLTDQRGWELQDKVHFVNVSPEQFAAGKRPEVRITLATPDTVDQMCAPMTTEGQVSCRNGDRVALNAIRWTKGVEFYPDDLGGYRIYMVNHEVGHAIGHGHDVCPGQGKEAPVMLQQTLHLDGCTRYPWAVPGQKL